MISTSAEKADDRSFSRGISRPADIDWLDGSRRVPDSGCLMGFPVAAISAPKSCSRVFSKIKAVFSIVR